MMNNECRWRQTFTKSDLNMRRCGLLMNSWFNATYIGSSGEKSEVKAEILHQAHHSSYGIGYNCNDCFSM